MRTARCGLAEPAYTTATLPEGARSALGVEPGSRISDPDLRGIHRYRDLRAQAGRTRLLPNDLEFGAGLIAQAAVAFENAWRLVEILAADRSNRN